MLRRLITHHNIHPEAAIKAPQRFFSHQRSLTKFVAPQLPILNEMANRAKQNGFPSLANTVIIGVQHILPTTAGMFDVIINSLGVNPHDIFLAGKFYSSCPDAENYMRRRGIHLMRNKVPKRPGQFEELMSDTVADMWGLVADHLQDNEKQQVVIFDEGAHGIEHMPKWVRYTYKIACLEQTRFGFYTPTAGTQLFPLTDVACSAAKRSLESPLIAEAVLRRIKEIWSRLAVNTNTVFGVVGNGAIGAQIVEYLLHANYKVVVFDENEHAFHNIHHRNCFRVDSIAKVIAGSNIIFGCTGRDITKGLNVLELVKSDTTFISTSSQDVEFRQLLKTPDKTLFSKSEDGGLSSLHITAHSGAEIIIPESGFPINFDKTALSDPVTQMELTRGLLFGAFLQCSQVAKKPIDDGATLNRDSHLMLDPHVQQFVAEQWLKRQPTNPYVSEMLSCFANIEWIIKNSNGKYIENPWLTQTFGRDGHTHTYQRRPI